MRYQGGKSVEGGWIAPILGSMRRGRPYWEPFCGGCGVLYRMLGGRRLASDVNPDLILLWRALQAGWDPPDCVSESEYAKQRESPPSPLRSFVGFGCSYAGKWFGGYARTAGRNFAAEARRGLLRRLDAVRDVAFFTADALTLSSVGFLVYCDPPYAGLMGYAGARRASPSTWDSTRFWSWVRRLSSVNTVVVSSFEAPPDFSCVSSFDTVTSTGTHARGCSIRVTERLFMLSGSDWPSRRVWL